MKIIEYNGVTYVNPSASALSELGVSADQVEGVLAELAALDVREVRDSRLAVAALRIAPLQDAVDLGSATDAEIARLTAWKQYRVDLSRISEQAGYPGEVSWPLMPSE